MFSWIILAASVAHAAPEFELCPTIHFEDTRIEDFTPLEKTLVCGEQAHESWSSVPLNQARLFLRSFLEKRGYHHPVFREEQKRLVVQAGNITRITRLTYQGLPEEIETQQKWNLINEALTSATLDQIEEWTLSQLRTSGYPCAQIKVQADPDSGAIEVQVQAHRKRSIVEIEERLSGSLYEGVLSRFYAFHPGDTYNLSNIQLTRTRIQSDGIVQNVFFDAQCLEGSGVRLKETVVPGPTNILKAGVGGTLNRSVGGNLEQGPEVTASWQKNRTDKFGSSVAVSAQANLRAQELRTFYKSYASRTFPRLYTQPQIRLRFENETSYSSRDVFVHYFLGHQWDTSKQSWALTSGPSWRTSWANRAGHSQTSRIIAWEAHGRTTTHDYESFATSPRTGYQLGADLLTSSPHLLSDVQAHQLTVHGHALWNYRRFDPPKWIAALRWSAGTTLTRGRDMDRLPPDFLYFLGGTQDLRAFDRKSLPRDGYGRLTSGYLGAELRWYKLLFRRIDPFVLADVGRLGGKSFQLNPETFFDYGIGGRWETGFGVFRLYVARGETRPEFQDPVTRVGLSFGEEF